MPVPAGEDRNATRRRARVLLAALLRGSGERLGRTDNGRPVLLDVTGRRSGNTDVSISYTAGLVVVALGRDVRCAVDVEAARAVPGSRTLRRHVLAPDEDLPGDDEQALLCAWTRKEALLKLTGEGLATDPRAVLVGAEQPGTWNRFDRGALRSLCSGTAAAGLHLSVAAERACAVTVVEEGASPVITTVRRGG